MANKLYNGSDRMPSSGGRPSTATAVGKPANAPFPVKPSFPSAALPGKAGPDRSAGVPRTKQYPKDIGL